jgi:hypothetical protein
MADSGAGEEDLRRDIEEPDRLLREGNNEIRRIVTLQNQIADLD